MVLKSWHAALVTVLTSPAKTQQEDSASILSINLWMGSWQYGAFCTR